MDQHSRDVEPKFVVSFAHTRVSHDCGWRHVGIRFKFTNDAAEFHPDGADVWKATELKQRLWLTTEVTQQKMNAYSKWVCSSREITPFKFVIYIQVLQHYTDNKQHTMLI